MVAHAELAEAERAHDLLRRVDLAQLLGGDRVAVLEARRQARERRLVPRRQLEARATARGSRPSTARPRSAARARRAPSPPACRAGDRRGRPSWRRTRARPRPSRAAMRRQPREQLLLAEEAAVGGLLRVVGIVELARLHDLVAHAEQRRRGASPPRARAPGTSRSRRSRAARVAERVARRAREQRRVDAAGERHDDALHVAQQRRRAARTSRPPRVDAHGTKQSGRELRERRPAAARRRGR